MKNPLNSFDRKIEIVRLLQGKRMRTGEIAEYFGVDDRTIRDDIDVLRQGMDVLGTKLKIESKHEGSQRHYYKSTVHPIMLGLNLSELFILLKLLEDNSKGNGGEVFKNLLKNIYSQISDYAEGRISPLLNEKYNKAEIVNILEEEAFSKHVDYKLAFWSKSGRYIKINYLSDDNTLITEDVKLIDIGRDMLKIENKEGEQKWFDYDEIIVDWSIEKYK